MLASTQMRKLRAPPQLCTCRLATARNSVTSAAVMSELAAEGVHPSGSSTPCSSSSHCMASSSCRHTTQLNRMRAQPCKISHWARLHVSQVAQACCARAFAHVKPCAYLKPSVITVKAGKLRILTQLQG